MVFQTLSSDEDSRRLPVTGLRIAPPGNFRAEALRHAQNIVFPLISATYDVSIILCPAQNRAYPQANHGLFQHVRNKALVGTQTRHRRQPAFNTGSLQVNKLA
jgi:hypothetical protein